MKKAGVKIAGLPQSSSEQFDRSALIDPANPNVVRSKDRDRQLFLHVSRKVA